MIWARQPGQQQEAAQLWDCLWGSSAECLTQRLLLLLVNNSWQLCKKKLHAFGSQHCVVCYCCYAIPPFQHHL
jgi:hypothetical protein